MFDIVSGSGCTLDDGRDEEDLIFLPQPSKWLIWYGTGLFVCSYSKDGTGEVLLHGLV
jgi:hypothetical protein